jgi:serine/threonine protein kinase
MTQINFLQRLKSIMGEEHLAQHQENLHVLLGKLDIATAALQKLVQTEITGQGETAEQVFKPKRVKYAVKQKSLDTAILEIESWQRLSDPTWFLVLRMADRLLDNELFNSDSLTAKLIPSSLAIRAGVNSATFSSKDIKGLSLPAADIHAMELSEISLSEVRSASIKGTLAGSYILDYIICPNVANYYTVKENIRDLVGRLQHDEPTTFGLLNCKGYATERVQTAHASHTLFTVVFRFPQGFSNPRSLRDYLLNTEGMGSLTYKIKVAQQLATSVFYLHTFRFVHKSIRPETIIVFMNPGTSLPGVYLLGFDNFRKEDGKTTGLGDETLEKNLYRHPLRQGLTPTSDFDMQHDIYSLGICLLEIGLWTSLINYDQVRNKPRPSALLGLPDDSSDTQIGEYLLHSSKEDLVRHAQLLLPERMGSRYTEVVETCLTCLDPGNPEFGDPTEFEDEDGVRIGVRYIEKVSHASSD